MSSRFRNLTGAILAVSLATAIAACSGGKASAAAPTALNGSAPQVPSQQSPNRRAPDLEYIELCKDYSTGSGPSATFTVDIDSGNDGTFDSSLQVTLASGECRDIWVAGGPVGDSVRITETGPAGYDRSWTLTTLVAGVTTSGPSVSGSVATGAVAKGNTGSLVIFTNTPQPLPLPLPPPPTPLPGTQGCTPGYWKQSQHFDSWPAPYTPTTLFSAVFADAFPGMTLNEVLSQGGGGLNALGRATVAALLNSASGSVNYGATPSDIINAFNAAFASGDYEALKDQFDAANNRGCPLN